MNILLFVVILVVSFIVVRIGAIAFELTGVEWSIAKFQSLSCFTGTGFTTKEAELISANPRRRRIASILMVLGNAGLVTLIATFANSLRSSTLSFHLPFVHLVFPERFVPWVNLVLISFYVFIVFKLFTHTRFSQRLTKALRNKIMKREKIKPVFFEELVVSTGGYGVSNIEIASASPIIDKTIRESELRSHDITILAVERDSKTIPNPSPDTKILLNDRLICFGKIDTIKKELLHPAAS